MYNYLLKKRYLYSTNQYPSSSPPTERNNKYQYNQKELNEDFGLWWNDYGARWQDPQLGRWHSVDPLAEKYYAWSGYNYVGGNPIRLVDPDGMEIVNAYEEFAKYAGLEEQLKQRIQNSTTKEERKQAKKELKENGGNIEGFKNYQTVENLLGKFKEANETEYNRVDNLQLNGIEIDVVVGISSNDGDVGQVGDTDVIYTKEIQITDFSTKETSTLPTEIDKNKIGITLYYRGQTLNTLANEFGDAIFATENPTKAYKDEKNKVEYLKRGSTKFSSAYEYYIIKKSIKPNPQDY